MFKYFDTLYLDFILIGRRTSIEILKRNLYRLTNFNNTLLLLPLKYKIQIKTEEIAGVE